MNFWNQSVGHYPQGKLRRSSESPSPGLSLGRAFLLADTTCSAQLLLQAASLGSWMCGKSNTKKRDALLRALAQLPFTYRRGYQLPPAFHCLGSGARCKAVLCCAVLNVFVPVRWSLGDAVGLIAVDSAAWTTLRVEVQLKSKPNELLQ